MTTKTNTKVRTRLTDMEYDEVSFVGLAANQEADIVLFKSARKKAMECDCDAPTGSERDSNGNKVCETCGGIMKSVTPRSDGDEEEDMRNVVAKAQRAITLANAKDTISKYNKNHSKTNGQFTSGRGSGYSSSSGGGAMTANKARKEYKVLSETGTMNQRKGYADASMGLIENYHKTRNKRGVKQMTHDELMVASHEAGMKAARRRGYGKVGPDEAGAKGHVKAGTNPKPKTMKQKAAEIDKLTPSQQRKYESAPAHMSHDQAIAHALGRAPKKAGGMGIRGGDAPVGGGRGKKVGTRASTVKPKSATSFSHGDAVSFEYKSQATSGAYKGKTMSARGKIIGFTPSGEKAKVKLSSGVVHTVSVKNLKTDTGPNKTRSDGAKYGATTRKLRSASNASGRSYSGKHGSISQYD